MRRFRRNLASIRTKGGATKDKISLAINEEKLDEARMILGTTTLSETVDAALDQVIRFHKRRWLMERIRRNGGIGPTPEEIRRLRGPREMP
jgi:Arc/MetJ family transcription regulator